MKAEFKRTIWYYLILAIIIAGIMYLGFWLGKKYENINCIKLDAEKQLQIINTAVFACPNNKAIYAVFTKNMVKLKLSDGRELTLPQTISGSGARYANADQSFIFWNKGNGAFIEENEFTTYQDCVTE